MAEIKWNIYRESRAMGWTAEAAKKNANETVEFMNVVHQLAMKHNDTVTFNMNKK